MGVVTASTGGDLSSTFTLDVPQPEQAQAQDSTITADSKAPSPVLTLNEASPAATLSEEVAALTGAGAN